MNKVKIGFIGCGGNARGHMASVARLENAQIVGVCDLVEELAQKASETYGGNVYTDYRKLFDEEAPDGVIISIPVFAHGDIELEAVERGIPFLVEKPVALDMAIAKKVAAAVRRKGLLTSVGYQLRYTAAAQKGKAVIGQYKVGMVEGRYWCGFARGRHDWRTTMAKSGGQLVEQATHTIDMMRYLVGEVEEVYSLQTVGLLEETGAPDVYVQALKFKNGAIGSMASTWALGTNDWSNANLLNLFFDKYHMEWRSQGLQVNPMEEAWQELESAGRDINQVFVNAIATHDGSGILSDYEDGVKSLAVALAANESARLGRSVRIAEILGE